MVSQRQLPPPAASLQGEMLNILRAQKGAAEEAAVRDLLLLELSASKEIEQLATYLLAFEGAAATVIILNVTELSRHFGATAVSLALLVLALGGSSGLMIRWIGLRIQAFLRTAVEARQAPIWVPPASQLIQALSEHLLDDEKEAVALIREYFSSLSVDFPVAFKQFKKEYSLTLGRVGRWRESKKPVRLDEPFLDVRYKLMRQHWQRRLLFIQAVLTVGFVVAVGVFVGFGLLLSR